jgi:hypothetical protein
MATHMISKFEKYWFEFSEVLAIVVILDPRYKLHDADQIQFWSLSVTAIDHKIKRPPAFNRTNDNERS